MREKATVRLICIIAGSIIAACLVPLAARARFTPPRLVKAPARSAEWSDWEQISLSEHDKGMHFSPALAAQGSNVYAMSSQQVNPGGGGDYDPHYSFSKNNGDLWTWWYDYNIQSTFPITTDTTSADVAFDSTGVPHFVWAENTQTPYSYTLYYSSTHISGIQVITQANALLIPVIAVGSQVHVVWSQGSKDIMHDSKAIASGAWGSATNVRHSTTSLQDPAIAVDGSTVHLVWSEGSDPTDTDIMYTNSNNWSSVRTVYQGSVFGNGIGYRPDIVARGSNLYVVWCAFKAAHDQYVRFGQSTNGGSSWSSSERISGSALRAYSQSPKYLRPSIAVDANGKIHIVFNGNPNVSSDSNEHIFYVSKTQGGNWRLRQNITAQYGDYNNTTPAITVSGDYVHLIWARQNWQEPTTGYNVWYTRASVIELESVFLPVILKSY